VLPSVVFNRELQCGIVNIQFKRAAANAAKLLKPDLLEWQSKQLFNGGFALPLCQARAANSAKSFRLRERSVRTKKRVSPTAKPL
jgi:hypothetical protein